MLCSVIPHSKSEVVSPYTSSVDTLINLFNAPYLRHASNIIETQYMSESSKKSCHFATFMAYWEKKRVASEAAKTPKPKP